MKRLHLVLAGGLLAVAAKGAGGPTRPPAAGLDEKSAERFARLALDCVNREYPNKIGHLLNSDADVRAPRSLTPAFFGCYDWHSSVHGHWLLARLARVFPDAPFARDCRVALDGHLTAERIAGEVAYAKADGRVSFERPYGLAWLLQLSEELHEWDDADARRWSAALRPLERLAAARLTDWLPKLSRPIRVGEHDQTAFAMGLALDWARQSGAVETARVVEARARDFYLADVACPLAYEPSGEDFLSPCLAEADLVRRVLPRREFAPWLARFLPTIPADGSANWLAPGVVTDPADPKLAHLSGLNLSRAWMLLGIASALPPDDPRIASIEAAASVHRERGLADVTGEHYVGGHWLGTFAVYLTTGRGISAGHARAIASPAADR